MLLKSRADELPNLHVLAISSDGQSRRRLSGLLARAGILRATFATSHQEALRKLSQSVQTVDIIVCDNGADNSDSIQLLRAVRTGYVSGVRADICFVILSEVRRKDSIEMAARLDVHAYLVKPVTADKLKAEIIKARARSVALQPATYASILIAPTYAAIPA